MPKKNFVYLVEIDMKFSDLPEGVDKKVADTKFVLDPYSSFDKAKKAMELVYDRCLVEAKKYPGFRVTDKQCVSTPEEADKRIWRFTWTVHAKLLDENYEVCIKRVEVQ